MFKNLSLLNILKYLYAFTVEDLYLELSSLDEMISELFHRYNLLQAIKIMLKSWYIFNYFISNVTNGHFCEIAKLQKNSILPKKDVFIVVHC